MLEHILASERGDRVVADWTGGIGLGRPFALHRPEGIDIPGGEGNDARRRKPRRGDTGEVRVDGPGPVRLARGPEFLAYHVDDVVDVGKASHIRRVEQVALHRLDARATQVRWQRSV